MKRIGLVVAVGVMLPATFFLGRHYERMVAPAPIVQVDTIIRVDTICDVRPVYVRERICDTLLVAVTDTICIRDTTFAILPRTSREYVGNQYRAIVSGVQPSLDTMQVFRNEVEVVRYLPAPPPPRFKMAGQAGYMVSSLPMPYAGVSASYSLLDGLDVYGAANVTYNKDARAVGAFIDAGIRITIISR